MRGLLYRLLHKSHQVSHPDGYLIYSEYFRFGNQHLTNLCVWDGTAWHQAPLDEWDRREGIDYLGGWIMGIVPQAFGGSTEEP